SVRAAIVDQVYVPLRYIFLAFLLLDGAQNRSELLMGICAIVAGATLSAIVIDRQIPLSFLAEQDADMRRVFWAWVQRHPNDISRDFGASFWILLGIMSYRALGPRLRWAALLAAPIILVALAHSHSRGGYMGFAVTGMVLTIATRSWKVVGMMAGLALVTI